MEQLGSLLLLIACIGAGMILGKTRISPPPRFVNVAVKLSLWLLLFSMGFRIGNNAELRSRLPEIGAVSLAVAMLAVLGTALAFALYALAGRAFFRRPGRTGPAESPGVRPDPSRTAGLASRLESMRGTLTLLGIVCLGFAAGWPMPASILPVAEATTSWMLYLLLFFIGIQLMQSGVDFAKAAMKPQTVILPLLTIAGTLAGALALSGPLHGLGLLHETHGRTLALAAGFGWYSLSGVLITNMGSPYLGSIAFLCNMIRETISLVCIPLLARAGAPRLAIGIAGATSMDVTLPLIEQCCGPEYVPASVVHGVLLSFLVPVLVPFFYNLG
jgi:uncharacterized membrane protein YbjE (DUF340 family)